MSNEKQLSLAIIQYEQDYDSLYPQGGLSAYGGFWIDVNISWPKIILPYIKSLAVYRCPDDSLQDPTGPMSYIGTGNAISYNLNGFIRDYSAFNQPANINAGPCGPRNTAGLTESKVTYPSSTILVAEVFNSDANKTTAADGTGVNGTWFNAFTMNYRAGLGWSKDYNGNIPDGAGGKVIPDPSNPIYNPNNQNGSVSAHHNAMANFAFCDGHVKAMRPYMTNPDYVNHPDQNLWDALRP